MSAQVSLIGSKAIIAVSGRFVFSMHGEFRRYVQEVLDRPEIQQIEIDLAQTDYLDSAALGMLLLLRERTMKIRPRPIRISGSSGQVRDVLAMCNFHRLFVLS